MEIGTIIRRLRKEKEITQEQLAKMLGVSPPAVNKWENDNSYPDITLLVPLARALGTDVDTLLSFREELTDKEINAMAEELIAIVPKDGYDAAFERAKGWLREYPNCEKLYLNMAQMLTGCKMMYGSSPTEEQEEIISAWYRRAAASKDRAVAEMAIHFLTSGFIGKKEFEEAQKLLDTIPEPGYDKRLMQITLLSAQGKYDEAYEAAEKFLWQTACTDIFTVLNHLADLSCKEKKFDDAEQYAQIAEQFSRLFQLWPYSHRTLQFQVASVKKEKEEALRALEEMFAALEQPWNMKEQFLYRHMKPKEDSMIMSQQMLDVLKQSIRDSEELDFLKGEPRFEELIVVR